MDIKDTSSASRINQAAEKVSPGSPPPKRPFAHKRMVIGLGCSIGAIIIIGTVFALTHKDKGHAPKPSNNSTASGDTTSDILTKNALQCVPRGHDYYRTNNAFVIDPTNPSIMYAGVEYKGVYKSTNGGATWKQSDKGVRGYAMEADASKKCVQELGRLLIDPKNTNHLLLSRVETPSTLKMVFGETAGLYESKDAGATWKHIISDTMNASGSRAIAFDPKDSQTIYYGINNGKPSFTEANGKRPNQIFNTKGILYKTTNDGKQWTELPTGAEEGFRASSVFVNSTDTKQLWLATFNQDPASGGQSASQKGILLTKDGGATWKNFAFKNALADFAVAPQHFNHLYAPLQSISGSPEAFSSTDGGASFQKANTYVMVARYDPYDPSGLRMLGYAPYGDASLQESKDGGKTWVRYAALPAEVNNQNQFGVTVSEIVWHPTEKNTVFMSGSGANVWKSTDGGKTWANILNLGKIGGENKNKAGSTKSSEQDH